ncbi:hypothetical protein WN944_015443 [Citrus x changshan-huyou]|uniref:Uncharacterized protein n=1 Tax=Citrus x changshan-huyou TaxID=2935761 RepID=A0AAP0MBV3_9ROSI
MCPCESYLYFPKNCILPLLFLAVTRIPMIYLHCFSDCHDMLRKYGFKAHFFADDCSSVFYKPPTFLISKMKHNNVIPNGHFKKHWQNYVKTWFNQPARKNRRRVARQKKAVKIFPRPTAGPLRPVVHGQTLKYNMKLRAGRGFTLEELKVSFLFS